MTDAEPLFDAIEQFKREHPEYVQAVEIMDQCRDIIVEYQRIVEARKPKVETYTATGTGRPPKRWVTYEP